MVLSQSSIPAADFLIKRDPWLKRLGAREPGRRISESIFECSEPILRGRPIYDRLPGAAQAYNKDQNTFISQGTIILPEAKTVISSAEDLYFRSQFPELYTERDYITGSFLGPGSAAALFEDNGISVAENAEIVGRNILFRSAILFWGNDAIRDDSNIAKQSIRFPGAVVQLPLNGSGWFWIDGLGQLQVTDRLPDGIASLTGNIWCNPSNQAELGQQACVQLVRYFNRSENYSDILDVGLTNDEITWPPGEECEEALLNEVTPLFKYTTFDGKLTKWEDFRRFNTSFDPPIARWITDYFDNLLQEKREVIDVFVDDYLNPDTIGLQFVEVNSSLRQTFRPETVDKILDSFDFGLITEDSITNGPFAFLNTTQIIELQTYDFLTNQWLDWLAQHFGLQDNGTPNRNYWHNGSFFDADLAENEVYYTIAEKRAILRNTLAQDPFQRFVEIVAPVVIDPIWDSFEDFWEVTQAVWNQVINISQGESEFQFSRFPFTVYNRIKPADWYGLMRAKGSIKGLEFMFDVLGLHGYACLTDEPRFENETADFEIPLIPFKFTNSVTVGFRKEVNEEGEIVATNDPFLQNYQSVVRTGETIFMSDYDRKVVVRAPFSWDRTSQQWNRLDEITNTYAKTGDVVTGYYHYITGRSSAGEPIWFEENCKSCRYLVTSRLLDPGNLPYYNDDPPFYEEDESFYFFENEAGSRHEYTWIQNSQALNTFDGVGFNRAGQNFQLTWTINPSYINERTILIGFESFKGKTVATTGTNSNKALPLAISYDNGCNFELLDPNAEINLIRWAKQIRVFSDNIYVVGNFDDENTPDTIIFSRDNAKTWNTYIDVSNATLNGAGVTKIYDIFHDIDGRRIYIATDIGIFSKFDNSPIITIFHLYDLSQFSIANLGAGGTDTPNISDVLITKVNGIIFLWIYEDNAGIVTIARTNNEGANFFYDFTKTNIGGGGGFGHNLLADSNITISVNNFIGTLEDNLVLFLYYATIPENDCLLVAYNSKGEYNLFPHAEIAREILQELANEDPLISPGDPYGNDLGSPIIGITMTDVQINFKTKRIEYLITGRFTEDIAFLTPFPSGRNAAIFSSNFDFSDFRLEYHGIEIYSKTSYLYGEEDEKQKGGETLNISRDFLIKNRTILDADPKPISFPINILSQTQIIPEYSIPNDYETIYIPCFDDEDDAVNAITPKRDKVTPINANEFLDGYKQISWKIPPLRDNFNFIVVNEEILEKESNPLYGVYLTREISENEFNPLSSINPLFTGKDEILLVSCENLLLELYGAG